MTCPDYAADERTLGTAELLMAGTLLPIKSFGRLLPLDEEARHQLERCGRLVLLDPEGVPFAELLPGGLPVRRACATAYRRFHQRYLRPADLPRGVARVGTVLGRPLLAAEVELLARLAIHSEVLLFVRTLDTEIPPSVVLSAVLASAKRIPGARVVSVPLARQGNDIRDRALRRIVTRNFGAEPAGVADHDRDFNEVRHALDVDDDARLSSLLDADALAALREWKPPRHRRGLVVFLTGLSGSGKTTVARALRDRLEGAGRAVTLLDSDLIRFSGHGVRGFGPQDRQQRLREFAWIAGEVARHRGVALISAIAPDEAGRRLACREISAHGDVVLVWVATTLVVCESRDPKGLYRRARAGEIRDFTGVSAAYEQPRTADVVLDTSISTTSGCVDAIFRHLVKSGYLSPE